MMELELQVQDPTFRGKTPSFIYIISSILNVRITNDAREDEMEENMQQVGSSLGILKNMAEDLGQTIDGQNKQIDKIGAKVKYFHVAVTRCKLRIFPGSGGRCEGKAGEQEN